MGLPRWPVLEETHRQCLAQLRERLDGESWDEAWIEGAQLSAGQAMDLALSG
jgi:hypothetical protein